MQFRDLNRQYLALKSDLDAAMAGVAAQGAFIHGPEVAELEQQLAQYVGVRHCITCGNGTDALTLALKAWGVGPGDAVFVPDFTFFASAEVVSLEGATPVFVDVDEVSFNISPRDLERAIAETLSQGRLRPRAVVAVDLFGQPADFDALRPICQKHNLLLLEDGAQGFGGEICGKRACGFGDIGTTSFFPAKPLGCYGDGGAVFTNNDEWAQLIRSYCVHGKGQCKYDNVRIGLNSRLDTLQAVILLVKLRAFAGYELEKVNAAAADYSSRLKDVVLTPTVAPGCRSSWAQYTLRLQNKEQRDRLQAALKARGIPSMVYYPTPMHLQSVYSPLGYAPDALKVSSRLSQTVLSLPMHPYLSAEEIGTVCDAVRANL